MNKLHNQPENTRQAHIEDLFFSDPLRLKMNIPFYVRKGKDYSLYITSDTTNQHLLLSDIKIATVYISKLIPQPV